MGFRGFIRFIGLAGLLMATPAAAQDVRVDVHVRIPDTWARDLTQTIRGAVGTIAPEVGEVIRDVVREVSRNISVEMSGVNRAIANAIQDRYRAEQIDTETKTLALGPNGSLDLRNMSGDITITAGGKDVVVKIVKRSRGRTDADAKLGLTRVTVEVTQRVDRATVESHYTSERNAPYSVDTAYEVSAPAGTRVTVNSMSGSVTVTGIHGELSASVMSGDVKITDGARVMLAKTMSGNVVVAGIDTDGAVEFGTMSGKIDLQRVKARRIEGGTVSGDVFARDVTADTVKLTSTVGSVEYSGELQRGGHYELQARNGVIRFNPTGPVGFEVQANTFMGEVHTDLALKLEGQVSGRGPRRSIRATFGDASAVVVLTTFSGSVTIGKAK